MQFGHFLVNPVPFLHTNTAVSIDYQLNYMVIDDRSANYGVRVFLTRMLTLFSGYYRCVD